ncbi:MAG: hypothetical protein NVS2B12_02800 [Ktedonobacteraceae bacterium]
MRPRLSASSSTLRVLFDNAHAETAGNADWVISKSQPDPLGENPNPQVESDWTGGISSWGVALQRTGRYSLKTNTSALTYGNSANPLDLSQFNELVLPEPNTLFTSAEKTAILTFVHNGGGLFMVADHSGSDRNNDGYDSLHIFNDLMNNGGVGNDPFGIQFDDANIAKDYPGVDTPNPDPILQGPFGTGTTSLINRGTTETINRTDNPDVVGVIYTTGSSNTGSTGVFFARSTYGSGRIVASGDSSSIDDGTCEAGHKCYHGWDEPRAQNGILYPNATEWLAGGSTSTSTPIATATSTLSGTVTPEGTPTTIIATPTLDSATPTLAATVQPGGSY